MTLGRYEAKNEPDNKVFYPQVEEFRGELLKTYINQRFDNLIQNTPEAKSAINKILNDTAYSKGIKNGFEAEGIRIYFKENEIVFYYMPLDDSAKNYVELSVSESQIEQYLNTDFGTRPAS